MRGVPLTALPDAVRTGSSQRLAFLDFLRGLAALYVMIYHLPVIPEPHLNVPLWAASWVEFGGSGVTLFFVVSAFSLCLTMPGHIRSGTPFVSFYVHRFFRIAPLFYVWMIVSYYRDGFIFQAWHGWPKIASGIFFYFNFVPEYANFYVFASWTIGVEMLFYAIFPFIYFRCDKITKKGTACLLFVFIYSCFGSLAPYWIDEGVREPYLQYLSVLVHLPVFMLGMVAFDLWQAQQLRHVQRRDIGLLLIAAFFALLPVLIGGRAGPFLGPFYWQGLLFVCLLLGLALAPIELLVNRTTRFLGKISYSVYLGHFTVIYFLSPFYRRVYALHVGTGVKFLAAVLLTWAVLVPLSYLSYRLIELPGMRLGRRILRRAAPIGRGSGADQIGRAAS